MAISRAKYHVLALSPLNSSSHAAWLSKALIPSAVEASPWPAEAAHTGGADSRTKVCHWMTSGCRPAHSRQVKCLRNSKENISALTALNSPRHIIHIKECCISSTINRVYRYSQPSTLAPDGHFTLLGYISPRFQQEAKEQEKTLKK